jgi:hypothetical protein
LAVLLATVLLLGLAVTISNIAMLLMTMQSLEFQSGPDDHFRKLNGDVGEAIENL